MQSAYLLQDDDGDDDDDDDSSDVDDTVATGQLQQRVSTTVGRFVLKHNVTLALRLLPAITRCGCVFDDKFMRAKSGWHSSLKV